MGLLLSPLILQHYGWRALFYLFGLAGVPLLAMWMLVVPNTPPASPSSAGGGGSAAGGSSVTLGQLMSKRATWAIIIANFGERLAGTYCQAPTTQCLPLASIRCHESGMQCLNSTPCPVLPTRTACCPTCTACTAVNHWGYFIYLNWMPTYFYKVLGEPAPP